MLRGALLGEAAAARPGGARRGPRRGDGRRFTGPEPWESTTSSTTTASRSAPSGSTGSSSSSRTGAAPSPPSSSSAAAASRRPRSTSSSSSSSRGRPRATWSRAASASRTCSTGPPRSRSSPPPARAAPRTTPAALTAASARSATRSPRRARSGSSAACSEGPAPTCSGPSLKELSLDGSDIAKMRAAGGTFFEARLAPRREDLGFQLATDQLLEVILQGAPRAVARRHRVVLPSPLSASSGPCPLTRSCLRGAPCSWGRTRTGMRRLSSLTFRRRLTRTTTPLES